MEHRIQLSATLLIAVKAKPGRRIDHPAIAGIKIDARPASLQEKSKHLVDALGNIMPAGSREIVMR